MLISVCLVAVIDLPRSDFDSLLVCETQDEEDVKGTRKGSEKKTKRDS